MIKKSIKKSATLLLFAALLLTFGCSGGAVRPGVRQSMDMSILPEATSSMVMARGQRNVLAATDFPRESAAPVTSEQWLPGEFTADVPETAAPRNSERKLTRSAHIRIRVENLDAADAFITNLMRQFNAYAATTHIEENSRHYSLRVPAHHYETFLAEMDGLGRLLNRFESTEDVTLNYFDLEGRLANKRELLRTFQSYLGRAANIEEILAVEARIADLQFNIERTETQFRHLANRIEYATIDLSILGPVTRSPGQGMTLGERLRQLLGNFGEFLSTVFVILIGIVIYGIPSLLLLALLFLLLFGRIGLLRRVWQRIKG